ncbi:type 1 glutamine amidotransferase family protein [Streptomyces albidoflavus]|uniref:hypothetical protein n=1 Tax=Streptomyces albidoflavus TaxID=1886 RepID=UPI0033CDE55D
MRIAFPLFDGFTALDLVGPYEILRMLPGAEIVLAGLLTGKSATTHWSAVRELESYGATYTPERVVTHPGDRLIIGAGVSAGIDLAITLAAELTSPAHAQAYQLGLEYDPRPPYDAGSLAKAPAEAKALLGVGEEDPGA